MKLQLADFKQSFNSDKPESVIGLKLILLNELVSMSFCTHKFNPK